MALEDSDPEDAEEMESEDLQGYTETEVEQY